MNVSSPFARWFKVICALLLVGIAVQAQGERPSRRSKAKAPHRQVELFDAIDQGDIEVKFIAKSDKEANVIIKNKTTEPLRIALPGAFAGVPVLAQLGGGQFGGGNMGPGGGGNNNNQNGQGGQSQGLGGGFGGGGLGGGGLGGGGGFGGGGGGFGGGAFNIAPEKVGKIEVACVCLEHGKDVPYAKIPYELRRIDSFTSNKEVHELLALLADGTVPQRVAQAAAWHFENGMSWEELASKRVEHLTGLSEPYFSPDEIHAAIRAASAVSARVAEREQQASESRSVPSLEVTYSGDYE